MEDNFLSHLIELRKRLIHSLILFTLIFLGLTPFSKQLYTWLALPLLRQMPKGGQMIATEVTTPFFVPLKVTLMAAFLIALPYILYQIWAFIAPGLYAHEKRLAFPLLLSSLFLFLLGMLFSYFLVLPIVFAFMAHSAPQGVIIMTDIDKYLSFILTLFLSFGFAFEVPIVVILLVQTGILSIEHLKNIRPYMIVASFIIGAVLTPPDVISQIMLAVPLYLLYESGILVLRWFNRGKNNIKLNE